MAHGDAFQILADPTRRRIVEVLRGGERQVNDVVERLDIHQSGVSRHLGILRDAGFVQVRPDGQRRLYSLRPEPFRELDAWLGRYRDLWEGRLDRFGKAVEAKQRARKSQPARARQPAREIKSARDSQGPGTNQPAGADPSPRTIQPKERKS